MLWWIFEFNLMKATKGTKWQRVWEKVLLRGRWRAIRFITEQTCRDKSFTALPSSPGELSKRLREFANEFRDIDSTTTTIHAKRVRQGDEFLEHPAFYSFDVPLERISVGRALITKTKTAYYVTYPIFALYQTPSLASTWIAWSIQWIERISTSSLTTL